MYNLSVIFSIIPLLVRHHKLMYEKKISFDVLGVCRREW